MRFSTSAGSLYPEWFTRFQCLALSIKTGANANTFAARCTRRLRLVAALLHAFPLGGMLDTYIHFHPQLVQDDCCCSLARSRLRILLRQLPQFIALRLACF
jgi:hypothetical protein